MNNNNTKIILAKLADRISEFQEKLSDSEYKDLCEGLGQIYKEVDKMVATNPAPAPLSLTQNLFQTNQNNMVCLCSVAGYKCINYNRFINCNNRERISNAVPLINRVFRLICPEQFNAHDKYIMFLKPEYNITTIIVDDYTALKTLDFLYTLSKKNDGLSFAVKFLNYICISNLILAKKEAFKLQHFRSARETNIEILDKLISFLGKPLTPELINISGVQQYIYQQLSIENIVTLINSLIDIKSEYLVAYNMAEEEIQVNSGEVQVNLEQPVINNHPMTTRQKKQFLLEKPNSCSFTYKKNCSLVVNGAIHKYKQGDKCKLNHIENSKFCEKHTK